MAKYTDKEMDRIISAGKKSYASMSNKGQPGGIRSIAPSARAVSYTDPVERMRGKYFDNRQDVSRDRLERRLAQQQENVFNRLTMFKPVEGTGGTLLQSRTPGGPSIADVYQASALKYGPTFSEIGSDITYATGKTASALGQKVMAGEFGLMGLAKSLYEQFTNSAAKAKDALVKGVNKLSDIDLEVLKKKDTGEYKFLSKKPEIQEVDNLEKIQMTEFDKANLIRQNMERVSTNILEKDNTVQSAKVFDDSFSKLQGYGRDLAGVGLPALVGSQTNNIQIQDGQATPITSQEFMEKEKQANEIFNDSFFNQTSNQMSGAPGFEIVTDYKSPEARMQELIEKNKVDNTNMFDLGINKAKNQLSELERIFGVDMQ